MLRRWVESGNLMEKRFGMRRRMAESISFGRLVAPSTRMRVSLFVARPSQRLPAEDGQQNPRRGGKDGWYAHVMNSAFL